MHRRTNQRRRPQYGPRRPKHNVPVNIRRTEEGFEAHIFCVGFARENIRIVIAEDMIYISGKREPADAHPDFLLQEYPVKSFERWFELSERVDRAAVTAKMEAGTLLIFAPYAQGSAPEQREVPITD